jgi:hypothetical protein
MINFSDSINNEIKYKINYICCFNGSPFNFSEDSQIKKKNILEIEPYFALVLESDLKNLKKKKKEKKKKKKKKKEGDIKNEFEITEKKKIEKDTIDDFFSS